MTPVATMFSIGEDTGGTGALVFVDYRSLTVTLVTNPSSVFETDSTAAVTGIGIYESSNSYDISVVTGASGSASVGIPLLDNASATTDPP